MKNRIHSVGSGIPIRKAIPKYEGNNLTSLPIRIIATTLWVALLGLPMLAQDAQKKSNPKRPNIVLIMCDDLGWGDVGFNGNTEVKTPNLDRLVAMGVTLNRFYAAGPD